MIHGRSTRQLAVGYEKRKKPTWQTHVVGTPSGQALRVKSFSQQKPTTSPPQYDSSTKTDRRNSGGGPQGLLSQAMRSRAEREVRKQQPHDHWPRCRRIGLPARRETGGAALQTLGR